MSLPLLLTSKLALLPSMCRHLCCFCNGNCCSCHNGIIAVVDAQTCLRHCQASVVTLVACHQVGILANVAMALLLSIHRVFAIVVIAIVTLMTMALLPLSICRHPCHCQDGVIALVSMALSPLICNVVVALVAMASLLSSSWHHHPCCNHVVVIINAQGSLPSLQCCYCPCCYSVVAVDAQVPSLSLQWQLSPLLG